MKDDFSEPQKPERRHLFLLCGLNLFLKTIFLFVETFPSDVVFYAATGRLLLSDILPYASFHETNYFNWDVYANFRHPNGPLNYIFYSLVILMFGESVVAIKLPMLFGEILITVYLYKICSLYTRPEKAFYYSLFYVLCIPCYYPGLLTGCDELITGAFALMGLYYFIKERYMLAGLFFALGISYKLYPVFFLLPISLFCFHHQKTRKFLLLITVLLVSYIIIALPYLLLCPEEFFQYNFGQANRFITVSYGEYFQNSNFFQPLFSFEIIPLTINAYLIMQLGVAGGYFIADLFSSFKRKRYTNFDFWRSAVFYVAILPLISLSFNYRYTQWLIPVLLVFLVLKQQKGNRFSAIDGETSHQTKTPDHSAFIAMLYVNIIFNAIIAVVYFIQFNTQNYKFIPFGVMVYNNYLLTFAICFLGYLIISLLLREESDLKYVAMIGVFQGLCGLLLYYVLQWPGLIERAIPFVVVSVIVLLFSLVIIALLLFNVKDRK